MKRILLLTIPTLALALPAFAFAGSQSYTTPGTYTFTVPASYGTLTVTVNGSGGGGGGGGENSSAGGNGASASFGTLTALGGGGGGAGIYSNGCSAGANGGTSGNPDSSVTGGGAAGGAGGVGTPFTDGSGNPHPEYSGCAGGAGGRATKTYTPSTLAPNTHVTVVTGATSQVGGGSTIVGGGGGGGGGYYQDQCEGQTCITQTGTYGQNGSNGSVTITWTDAAVPPSCSISFDQNPLTGNSTTMHWNSQNTTAGEFLVIHNVGPVAGSGQATVFSAGDYTGTIYASDGVTALASCPATLQSGNQCVAGNSLTCESDGNLHDSCGNVTQCLNGCSTATNTCNQCPAGEFVQNGACVNSCSSGFTQEGNQCVGGGGGSCPVGQFSQNGQCVGTCSAGYVQQGSSCVFNACPSGYTQSSDQNGNPICTFSGCPLGFVQQGNQCVFNACPLGYTQGTDQNGNTICRFTGCPQGYSENGNGQCVLTGSPNPQGDIVANPSVVSRGHTTQLSWSAQNVSSCTIVGTNGDSWSCSSQGACLSTTTKTTLAIQSFTEFTLSCNALDGSHLTRAADVNLVPTFNEQ